MGLMDFFAAGPSAVPSSVPAPDQTRELVLYKYDACPFCARVQRVLRELPDVEVEMQDVRMDRSARDHLQQVTGRTTVPCLFVDGEPLFESADIVTWLQAYAKR